MRNRREIILLVIIVLIASLTRLWQIGAVPPSPDWDEAALGYNAYSITMTGKDEFGKQFPIIFRSFDDYKPGLYVYLAIPSIVLFGLNIFAVRLPSALFGILTVLATYYLAKELIRKTDNKGNKKANYKLQIINYLPLISAGLLSISPWHIQFSRIAFEANVGASFVVFGLLFFLKGFRRPILFVLSTVFFALSAYVYQSEKVFVPLFAFALAVIYRKDLLAMKKKLILPIVIGVLIALPFYHQTLFTEEALLRAKGVSVFADQTPFLAKTVKRLIVDQENNNLLGIVLDNRRITYAVAIASNYLSHLDLNWLFITGDLPRHQPPNMGHEYLVLLPFLLFGIYGITFSKVDKKTKWLLFSWALIIPIPASITTGVPHSIRTLHFIPLVQIIMAFGVIYAYNYLKTITKHKLALTIISGGIAILLFFNVLYYLDQYFVQYNIQESREWQYGYEKAVEYIESIENDYDAIVVTNKPPLDQSYMFFLFYTKYSPKKYLEEGGTKSGGFAEENGFGKYIFRPIHWEKEQKDKKTLFVGRPGDFPPEASVLKTVYYLDGSPAIIVVKS